MGFEIGAPRHAVDRFAFLGRERGDELDFEEPEQWNGTDHVMSLNDSIFVRFGMEEMDFQAQALDLLFAKR